MLGDITIPFAEMCFSTPSFCSDLCLDRVADDSSSSDAIDEVNCQSLRWIIFRGGHIRFSSLMSQHLGHQTAFEEDKRNVGKRDK